MRRASFSLATLDGEIVETGLFLGELLGIRGKLSFQAREHLPQKFHTIVLEIA